MPSTSHHPRQDRTLGLLLREVYDVLQQQVYEAVATAGHPNLRATHSPVLRNLSPEGGRVADLARATGLAKQSAAYVVEDLVKLGYLRTAPDPNDGRARRVTYTARGQELLAALATASREAEAMLASRWGPKRLRLLRSALEALLREPPYSDRTKRSPRKKRARGD